MKRLLILLLAGCGAPSGGDPDHPALAPFPAGFLWGTATAPYQIEGGLHGCDWYQWESTSKNVTMAHADDGDHSFTEYDADNQVAEEMDNDAMRLGIDFSRLFPTADSFPDNPDSVAVQHYHDVFASMKKHHLQPMVTLYHWALPTWVQDLTSLTDTSGWLDDNMPDRFARFAGWAAKEYGGEVDLWVTLNEPVVNLTTGYIVGLHPPLRSFTDANGIDHAERAAKNLVYAHARAYDAIHQNDTADADGDGKPALVSIAFHQRVFIAAHSDDPATQMLHDQATERIHYIGNVAFLDAVTRGNLDYDLDEKLDGPNDKTADPSLMNRLDWIGLNYYGVSQVSALGKSSIGPLIGLPKNAFLDTDNPKSEYGWDIFPSGFRTVLDELAPYKLPIYVTENGIADAEDAQRPRFLVEHLYVLEKAIQDGADVRGYFHWSAIDNFEWSAGYCPRFGLYQVDFADPARRRSARPSAALYKQIIDAKSVDPSLFAKYPDYPMPSSYCKGGG